MKSLIAAVLAAALVALPFASSTATKLAHVFFALAIEFLANALAVSFALCDLETHRCWRWFSALWSDLSLPTCSNGAHRLCNRAFAG